MTLIKLSTSIWDIIFRKIRVLYIFVVRSILIYEAAVWHDLKEKKTRTINKLAIIQNRCLRSIFETFRVILIAVLKTETHVALIDIHLNRLQTHARYRMRVESMSTIISKTCDRITNKLSDDSERSRLHRLISSELKRAWAERQLSTIQRSLVDIKVALWTNFDRAGLEEESWMFHRQKKKKIDNFHAARWQQRWKRTVTSYRRQSRLRSRISIQNVWSCTISCKKQKALYRLR
jgi:hypothetical protein